MNGESEEKPLTKAEIIQILAENQRSAMENQKKVTEILDDHEKRLKKLEKDQW